MSLAPPSDRERFVAFAFAAAELLVELDPEGRVTYAAGAFEHRLGCAPAAALGRPVTELLAPEERACFAAALASLPLRGRLTPTAFRLANAQRTACSVSGLHLAGRPEAARLCLTFSPLPGIPDDPPPTREGLLREARRRALAGEGGSVSLLEIAGVEHAGSAVPAVVLREMGGALAAPLAPGRFGVVLDPAEAARGGGRRLCAVLADQLAGAAVRLAGELPLDAEGLTPAQAARALGHGLAAFARSGAEGLAAADGAGGLPAILARVAGRAGTLRRVIAGRRFGLLFQPIVHLSRRQTHHYEALLRPDEAALEPGETTQDFVAAIETLGLTEDLDLAVAAAALAATAAAPAGRAIAFNLSGLSAQSPRFRDRLFQLLDQERKAAQRAVIELTETAAVEDEAECALTLRRLRERGVPVCLDDFGAGAAAFRYLQAFPVDYLKVDGGFVQAAAASERDRGFVAAMVSLSRTVGAQVVAERVDSEPASVIMQEIGVDFGQGWLFGRPGPL